MVLSGAEKGRVERVGAVAPPVESAVKRQRSQEEEILRPKKPRTGGGPPKSFSEVAKQAGSITLGVVDNSREDGAISRDEWKIVASAISAVFMKVVRENPGPPPCWQRRRGFWPRIVRRLTSGCWRRLLKMKILQINLQHSKAASANLLIHLEQGGVDVVLIQEPWLSSSGISGIRTKNYLLMAHSGAGKPRSCILIRKELNAFILPHFSNEDIVSISLENTTGRLWLISAYMAHDDEVEPPPLLLREALAEARRRKVDVIIGTDANSHHTCWGSSDINSRADTS
ncbi:uncharacterized protein LOC128870573 [Anastrepha ludens]|uniref:uncharacterized protein LOC128870573 n=1 Tax=Anastrepha ludens TaxID=28586 RepID=UPI0023B16431|nr:uncharacterized protein LOC128870573 [Anastrepha ludens]